MACQSEDLPTYFDTEERVTKEIANMKEALSTASLPQQGSPGCDAQKIVAERPYGSLKKRRGSRQQRTQWRRSWASGSGQSLNSANSSLGSLGMDEFYAAVRGDYDYIMDTNLIETCKEAHGDLESSPPLRDGASDLHLALKPQQWRQPETAARKDVALLRRWLRDVEARLEAHSLRDATRWTRERQQRCLGELADLQIEISAQGRVVGALLRAYGQEDKSKEETNTTGKDSENSTGDCPRGIRGLERRYHLLYLRALEWQCLLEGLLTSSIPSTPSWACSQSDHEEEPLPKQARLSTEFKRSSLSPQSDTSDEDESSALTCPPKPVVSASSASCASSEADVESLDGASRTANGISLNDCTSSDMDTDSDFNDNKDFVLTKITDTVIKRVKNIEISKYNRSNRTADNVATFYFKHRDTDSEIDHRSNSNVALTGSEFDAEEFAMMSSESDNEKQQNNDMSENIANLVNGNEPHANSEDQIDNAKSVDNAIAENAEFIVPTVRKNATRKSQDNIRKLVQEAEHLVREDSDRNRIGKQSRTRNFDNASRIKEWLRKSSPPCALSTSPSGALLDSCDASGECTSSSDSEAGGGANGGSAESSGEPSGSVATYRRALGDSQATSTELIDTDSNGAPTVPLADGNGSTSPDSTSPVKVVMRTAKSSAIRPWSVSCVSQLTPNGEMLNVENLQKEIAEGCLKKSKMAGQFSHSESALHNLDNMVSYQGDLNKTDHKFDIRKKKFRLKKRQARKSESSNDAHGTESSIGHNSNLVKSRSFSGHSQINLERILSSPTLKHLTKTQNDKCHLTMPVNFEIGGNITNAPILENIITSEEHSSSFSEAWDNYQDNKYLSEFSYSECVDTEAARRLLEFGEDYRNYLDSQSDCCSSLSNFGTNLDVGNKKFLKNLIANSPDYIRKSIDDYSFDNSDGTDLDCRKKRPDLHQRRRSSKERRNSKMTSDSDSSKNSSNKRKNANGMKSNLNGPDTENLKRKSNSKLKLKMRSNAMADSDSDLDELRRLVTESKIQLDRSEALWCSNDSRSETDRGVILQPRDYAEIILTCRENIRCLEAVMTRACGAILNDVQGQNLRGKLQSSTPLGAGLSKLKIPEIKIESYKEKVNIQDKDIPKNNEVELEALKRHQTKCLKCELNGTISSLPNIYNVNINKTGKKKNKFIGQKRKQLRDLRASKWHDNVYTKLCEISNQLQSTSKSESTLRNISNISIDDLDGDLSEFFSSLKISTNFENEDVNSILSKCGELKSVCKCHPIARFVNFTINYISDWKNFIWNCTLFTFLCKTIQQFTFLIFGIKFYVTKVAKKLFLPW